MSFGIWFPRKSHNKLQTIFRVILELESFELRNRAIHVDVTIRVACKRRPYATIGLSFSQVYFHEHSLIATRLSRRVFRLSRIRRSRCLPKARRANRKLSCCSYLLAKFLSMANLLTWIRNGKRNADYKW